VFSDRFKRGENRDALQPLIEEWLMERTVAEVFDLAGEARLPFAPVSNIGYLLDSPQLKARGFFVKMHTPNGNVDVPGAPYVLSATPWELRTPAPRLGQHTEQVLAAIREGVRR
jgi:crotonobetainyl-CoA:carnitine CoA-transferase CaiB-like acyl-CoA transferase